MSGLGQLTIEGLPKKIKKKTTLMGPEVNIYWKQKIKKIYFNFFKD